MLGDYVLYGESEEENLALAKILYEEDERLDPSVGKEIPFEELDFVEREIYRALARAIFLTIKSRSVTRPTTT